MKLMRKLKKRYLIIFLLVVTLCYFGPSLWGYTWTKDATIKSSYPFQGGKVVFDKKFGKYDAVILDTGTDKYAELIENPMGIVYRSIMSSVIGAESSNNQMKVTWFARIRNDKLYDTILAAEILNKDIVKVIVSNDKERNKDLTLSEVRSASSFFTEMDVHNGYAVFYSRLPQSEIGDFVFRGVNSEGEVITLY